MGQRVRRADSLTDAQRDVIARRAAQMYRQGYGIKELSGMVWPPVRVKLSYGYLRKLIIGQGVAMRPRGWRPGVARGQDGTFTKGS